MSLGCTGTAHLANTDGKSALYTYVCENWNVKHGDPVEDGEVYVELEPIVSARKIVRTKRYPDGIPLRWAENVDTLRMLEDGTLQIKNCSNATKILSNGVDHQPLTLFLLIAFEIQKSRSFPPVVAYIQ